jgi:hypothetical protein
LTASTPSLARSVISRYKSSSAGDTSVAKFQQRNTTWNKEMAVREYIERFESCDTTFKEIFLVDNLCTDTELNELIDCLLAHPNVVTRVYLGRNQLTNESGVKLARYVGASSTIEILDLSNNQFGSATFLAMAAALRVNTSLQYLYLHGNQDVDKAHIDTAFVEALRLNPDRSVQSVWCLYSFSWFNFKPLKHVAEQLGHLTLQELICGRYLGREISSTTRTLE